VESFSYACKQAGITAEEMEEMTIGDCLDFIQEFIDSRKKQNGQGDTVRKATQEDMDNF
jgi:hypothetical protein